MRSRITRHAEAQSLQGPVCLGSTVTVAVAVAVAVAVELQASCPDDGSSCARVMVMVCDGALDRIDHKSPPPATATDCYHW